LKLYHWLGYCKGIQDVKDLFQLTYKILFWGANPTWSKFSKDEHFHDKQLMVLGTVFQQDKLVGDWDTL